MATATTQFVESLYVNILHRNSDAGGLSHWSSSLDNNDISVTNLVNAFVNSQEFIENTAILAKLYYSSFGRMADKAGLTNWANAHNSGVSFSDIATSFTTSAEYILLYGTNVSIQSYVESLYVNALGRASDATGKAHWIHQAENGMSRSDLLLSFANSTELATLKGAEVKTMATYIALVNRVPTTAELAATATQTQIVNSLLSSVEYSGAALPNTNGIATSGIVSDGYISGAIVFADANGDGVWNAGEAKATTDASGNFTLTGGRGSVIASGGTDISTGLAFGGIFTAPAGSTTISPLTTLVDQVMRATPVGATPVSVTEAVAKVSAALGLPTGTNLLTFDPIAAASNTTLSATAQAAAVAIQAAAVQVTNMLSQSASMLSGAGVANEASGSTAAAAALAAMIVSSSAGSTTAAINLASPTTVQAFLTASAVQAGATTAQVTAVAAVLSSIATATANINSVMATTVTNAASGTSAANIFANLSNTQLAAANIANLTKTATSTGSTTALAAASDTGSITATAAAAQPGTIPTTQPAPPAGGGGGGDTTAPTATLTYSTDGGSTYISTVSTKDADTLKIKATFSEAIADGTGATITINNSILSATAMTKVSTTVYTYDLNVPAGDIAAAAVTIGAAKDAAGNLISATPTNATFTIDNTAPTAPTAVAVTPTGGTVVANTLNGTNTNMTAVATITAGQATGGAAVLKVGATTIATDSTILAGDTGVTFNLGVAGTAALQSAVAAGGVVTVEVTDTAGNTTASTASNPTLTVDYTAPTAPTAVTLTPTGGTVVANTLNGTNTNMTAVATITAGQATGGAAVLKVGATTIATDSTILAGDTGVTFNLGVAGTAALQSAVAAGGVVTVEVTDTAKYNGFYCFKSNSYG